jgi:hypothetical protein
MMKPMKKKQIAVGVLVVAVIAIAVGAGYYSKQTEPEVEVDQLPVADTTSNITVSNPADSPYAATKPAPATTPSPADLTFKAYSGAGFTFNYPEGWSTLAKNDSSVGNVVYILKPGQSGTDLAGALSVYRYRQDAKPWASLEDIKKYEQELDAETSRLHPEIGPRSYAIITNAGLPHLSIYDSLQGNQELIFLQSGVAYDFYYNMPKYNTNDLVQIGLIVLSFKFK